MDSNSITDGTEISGMPAMPRRKSKTLARLKKLKAQKVQDQLDSETIKSNSSPRVDKVGGSLVEDGDTGEVNVNADFGQNSSPSDALTLTNDAYSSSLSKHSSSAPPLYSSPDGRISNRSDVRTWNKQDHVQSSRTSAISQPEDKLSSLDENVSMDVGSLTSSLDQRLPEQRQSLSEVKEEIEDGAIRKGQDVTNINLTRKVLGQKLLQEAQHIFLPHRSKRRYWHQPRDKDESEDEAIGSASSDCGSQPLDQSETVLKYSDISAGNVTYKNQQNRGVFQSSDMDMNSSRDALSDLSHPGTSGISSSKRTDCSESDLTERLNSRTYSEPPMGSTESLTDTNRSYLSTGALRQITTQAARRNQNRSYLMGGVRNTGSLLGKEELERILPDRKIRVFVSTWNMHEEKVLPDNLEDLVLPEESIILQDIYVVGTQESTPDADEWAIRMQETLGTTHILLHKASLGVLHLLIFIRRDLFWFCSPVEEDSVATRPGAMIKTKGAVAVSFTFFGTSFLFLVSHFTSGDDNLSNRIQDYAKIIRSLDLPIKVPATRKYNVDKDDITSRFDAVFWCGDFNFRLTESRAKIENWAQQLKEGNEEDFNILLQHDQLRKTMTKSYDNKVEYTVQDSIFKGFQEGEINFLPTYKYNPGEDVFDTSSKARIPSYTDRVLYKPRKSGEVNVLYYNSCPTIKCSDHRPVYGIYEVTIRPGRDDHLCGTPNFAKDVFVEANRRRAAAVTGTKSGSKSQKSAICSLM
ncbi:hypothetical protein BSL78_12501 [Apostichopus japonicus]|uniref:Inositol polyphosphate-related phosphatase domain-containing protein n=1 Tax=Stichopus japonicus TaxID=307972 RepID=A0A2G8KRR6_STIJA|nr:hypothetical protein BSL78_12501 [Apostichopus japonicus]